MIDPCIIRLPNNNIDFKKINNLNTEQLYLFSKYPPIPNISLGYHYFIDKTVSKLEILDKITEKNIYLITLPFNDEIKNYDNNIKSSTETYLNLVDKLTKISDKTFYVYWELFMSMKLLNKKNIKTLIFSSYDGIFQAYVNFRLKFFDLINDKISILDNNNTNLINFYNKIYKNIKKEDEIKNISDVDLIIFDKDIEKLDKYNNMLSTEYQLTIHLLENIENAVNILNTGGTYIIKLYDIYNNFTFKIISILTSLFSESYIIKPFSSNLLSNYKYLVCKEFKLDKKTDISKKKEISEIINKIIKKFNSSNKLYLNELFFNIEINENLKNSIIVFNNLFNKINLNQINNTVKYINSKNYFGEEFYNFNQKQIVNSELWITKYYPINKLDTNLELIESDYKTLLLNVDKKVSNLEKNLF